jgi:hypothetical protein
MLQNLIGQNAPVTTALQTTCNPGTNVDIPITVTDFNNIGALSLTLLYDESVLTFQSSTNNSDFPSLMINGAVPGKIVAGGFIQVGDPGISLPDNSILFTLTFYYIEGSSALQWFDNGESCEYTDDQYNPLNDSPTCLYYKDGSVNDNSFQLNLKIYLEGPFLNGEMTTQLNTSGLVPTSQPYSGSPWYYDGLEAVSTIPDNVVDWVLIELRETTGDASTATADKMISRQAAFLLKDGLIISSNVCNSNLKFSVSVSGNLYVIIYHRNHIAAISASPILIVNGNGNYDFSSDESKVLGGSLGHKELSSGIWGLAAGDSNGDGIIDGLDKQNDWESNVGIWGYLPSDFSFDSQIDNIDKNDFWNTNFDFMSRVP